VRISETAGLALLDKAEAALRACLERAPFVALKSLEREPQSDGPTLDVCACLEPASD
jgi:hypothetical protein